MKICPTRFFTVMCLAFFAGANFAPSAGAQTRTLRIVCYNIEDDIAGATTPLPGLIAPPGNTNNF